LLEIIKQQPGINRAGLHAATGRNLKAKDLDTALHELESKGLAHKGSCADTGGRPTECWYPGAAQPEPEPEQPVGVAPASGLMRVSSETIPPGPTDALVIPQRTWHREGETLVETAHFDASKEAIDASDPLVRELLEM